MYKSKTGRCRGQRIRKVSGTDYCLFRIRKLFQYLRNRGILKSIFPSDRWISFSFCCKGFFWKALKSIKKIKLSFREQPVQFPGGSALVYPKLGNFPGQTALPDLFRQKPDRGKPEVYLIQKGRQILHRTGVSQILKL